MAERINKARFWWAVLYPENMRPDWKDKLGDIVQHPYAYCVHSKDKDSQSEHRKDHVHLILAFPNTTTYKHAMNVFDLLSEEDKKAVNKCEAVINIRNTYNYLIHDTDTCRKAKKELYDAEDRITGNNFDIGAYEQLGVAERNEICRELASIIVSNGFTNFTDFYAFVMAQYEDTHYFDIVMTHTNFFSCLCKGNFHKRQEALHD